MNTVVILSLDQVNRWDGAGWAAEVGLDAISLFPRELRPGEPSVVVCDWDFWPQAEREHILEWFRVTGRDARLIVKASTLDEHAVRELTRQGAFFWPRWDLDLFRRVARLLAPVSHATRPSQPDTASETICSATSPDETARMTAFDPSSMSETAEVVCFQALPKSPSQSPKVTDRMPTNQGEPVGE